MNREKTGQIIRVMKTLVQQDPRFNINEIRIIVALERGSANSRAKDIYDLIYLFPRCADRNALVSAIRKTFVNRGTSLPGSCMQETSHFDKTILKSAWPAIKVLDEKMESFGFFGGSNVAAAFNILGKSTSTMM